MVSGVGYLRAKKVGGFVDQHHEIRRVVSNLGVFDFETPDHTMRLRTIHPGVSIEDVVAATGFALSIPPNVPTSREPNESELALLTDVLDPGGARHREVKS